MQKTFCECTIFQPSATFTKKSLNKKKALSLKIGQMKRQQKVNLPQAGNKFSLEPKDWKPLSFPKWGSWSFWEKLAVCKNAKQTVYGTRLRYRPGTQVRTFPKKMNWYGNWHRRPSFRGDQLFGVEGGTLSGLTHE